MTAFTPNGRTHRILARLAQSDCGFAGLIVAVHPEDFTEYKRRKLWRLVDVLLDRDLIADGGRSFYILPWGLDELERLEAGGSAPNARVFIAERAA